MPKRDPNNFVTCPGDPIHVVYSPKVLPNGTIELVPSGKEDTDAYIQSHKESTDLAVILARVKMGEEELLYARPGSYGDFTRLPKTYAEMLQLQIDSNRLFEQLPPDVKSRFGNDPNQFLASAGTESWFKSLDDVFPDEVKHTIFPDSVSVKSAMKEESVNES